MERDGKERAIRAGEKGQGRRFFLPSPPRSSFFSPLSSFALAFFYSLTPTFFVSLFLSSLRPKPNRNSATNAKHVFYLSAEFLMGRSMTNAVGNLKLEDAYGEAVKVRKSFPSFPKKRARPLSS